jgi:hypothetical protein
VADTGHLTFHHEGLPVRATVKDCKKVDLMSTTTAAAQSTPTSTFSPSLSSGV